jgi:hypothetical protein
MAIERTARMPVSDSRGTRLEYLDQDGSYVYAVVDRETARSLMSSGISYGDFERRVGEIAEKKHAGSRAKSGTIPITAGDFG